MTTYENQFTCATCANRSLKMSGDHDAALTTLVTVFGWQSATVCNVCAKQSKKPKRDNTDKKGLFLDNWRLHRPLSPQPVTEYRFAAKDTGRQWQLDAAFVEQKLAVEIDGATQMVVVGENGKKSVGGRHNTDADRQKTNWLAILGWRLIRFTPQQLQNDPLGCIELVDMALGMAAIDRDKAKDPKAKGRKKAA